LNVPIGKIFTGVSLTHKDLITLVNNVHGVCKAQNYFHADNDMKRQSSRVDEAA
jgi:hypothetical protein